jgi:hypothetical protein
LVEKHAKAAKALSRMKEEVAPVNGVPPVALESRLKQLVAMAPMVLFMKGTPQQPRCGFTKQCLEILNKHNARYSTFNILADDSVRQGKKTNFYSQYLRSILTLSNYPSTMFRVKGIFKLAYLSTAIY